MNVYEQSTVHFDCLSAEFFAAVLGDASCGGVLFLYRHAGALIGFNLCFEHDNMLVDKYVGFRYPQARDFNLYFVSWFRNLEYARARGLQWYVAGWTDPQVKQQLGARFTWTRHAVYVRNPLLRAVLRSQRRRFEADREWHAHAIHRS
jgi:predicted N-acyltransferase